MEFRMNKIQELVREFIGNVDEGIQENIQHESVSEYHTSVYTTYAVEEDIEELLYKIGVELKSETLIDLFKKPKTIQEIVSELNENTNFSDYEELEEIESTRDAESEPKYVYIIQFMKHKPTGKFYQFTTQTQGDVWSKPEFMGEVENKEVVQTIWVSK